MLKRTLLSVLYLFIATYIYGQEIKPEVPKFVKSVEGIKEYSLSNGLQVLLLQDASQSNMIVNIVYKVGSRHEGYGETGMAHLLEHMLFKSTKKLGDIKKMLSDKGGNANGTTWYDRTNYFEIFPASDENLKWSIEMEADRMINATMLQSDLDTEFSVVRNEFEIGENSPSGVLMERILSTAYLWHNYGNSTIGSKEDIERVKADRLKVFYEKYYQPDNATLIISGKFDEQKALQYVADYFSVIPRPARVLEKTYTVEPAQDGERMVELKRKGDTQIVAAAYHTAPYADKDFAAIDLLIEIMTSEPSGYIYKNLIDNKLGTTLWAFQPTLRDAGFSYINFEIPKDKDFTTSKNAFVNELDKIATRTYTNEDLNRGKSKIQKQLSNVFDNTISFTINLTEIIGAGDYRLIHLYRDNIDQVTVEDLNRVAAKYFKPNNRTLGVFIPSENEERVKPSEITDDQITILTKDYQGKKSDETLVAFDANIANIKKNLTVKKLKTGMEYALLKKPIKGEKVYISFNIPMGNEKDLYGRNWDLSLLTSLMNAGTKTMTKEQIQDKMDTMKTNVRFYFNNQNLVASVSTYKQHVPEVMKMLHSMLTESVFPEAEIEKVKAENKAWNQEQMNNPDNVANNKLTHKIEGYTKGHIFYSGTPQENIDGDAAVTRASIVDFYQKFLGGNHAMVSIVGDLDAKQLDALMQKHFGKWTSNAKYEKINRQFFETEKYTESINTPDKENGVLYAAINIKVSEKNPEYPAVMMLNEMLGSGGFMTSRVPTRLREKEGISYGAGTYLNNEYDSEVGTLYIYAYYNPTFKDRVDNALKEEIAKVLKDGFSEEELKTSIISWQNSRNTNLGNDNFLAYMISNSMENKSDLAEFDELEAKVLKLTAKEVNEVAKKYLDPEKMVFIYAGDFNKK